MLTPEQKRERQRLKKARQRTRIADKQWTRLTNSGWLVELEVLHWLDMLDFLVALELLDDKDVENVSAIEEAVEQVLWWHFAEVGACREAKEKGLEYQNQFPFNGPGPNFHPRRSGLGTVRFRVRLEDADVLELEIEDRRGIKERLEQILFRHYADIEILRGPDAYGIAWGSWNYGRGWRSFEKDAPKPEPVPTWTDAEVRERQTKFDRVSKTSLTTSKKEARDIQKKNERELTKLRACAIPIRTPHILKQSPRRRRGQIPTPPPDYTPPSVWLMRLQNQKKVAPQLSPVNADDFGLETAISDDED
jgi:hypothetical protein